MRGLRAWAPALFVDGGLILYVIAAALREGHRGVCVSGCQWMGIQTTMNSKIFFRTYRWWRRGRGRDRGRHLISLLRLAQGPPEACAHAILGFGEVRPGVVKEPIVVHDFAADVWKFLRCS